MFAGCHIDTSLDCIAYNRYKEHTEMDFVLLSEQILPNHLEISNIPGISPWQLHNKDKQTGLPNFLGARILPKSQLDTSLWKHFLRDYWDQQLLKFLEFGFPVGFNRNCPLHHANNNHSSSFQYPGDIAAYLDEEIKHGAIFGLFDKNLINNCHIVLN